MDSPEAPTPLREGKGNLIESFLTEHKAHPKDEWHAHVEAEVATSHNSGEPLSVLFIDLNNFKDVNDTQGHEVGDKIIRDVDGLVSRVAHSFRTNHTGSYEPRPLDKLDHRASRFLRNSEAIETRAGSIGGDEFAVLCHTDEEGAEVIARRLRRTFKEYLEARPELEDLGVGLAIGVGILKPGMDCSDLLTEADKAMYKNKMSQLKPLSFSQRMGLKAAKLLLDTSQIRVRDLPKYLRES